MPPSRPRNCPQPSTKFRSSPPVATTTGDRIRPTGFTILELVLTVGCSIAVLTLALPVLGRVGSASGTTTSLNNLMTLGVAHTMYAADWNGAQFSIAPYDLGAFGSVSAWNVANGNVPENYNDWGPVLGWGQSGALYWYYMGWPGNHSLAWPIHPLDSFGWFRLPNAAQFHQYVNGRFYDPLFYAPNDTESYSIAQQLFDEPWSFVNAELLLPGFAGPAAWSSYCLSPAALFHPGVMRNVNDGGYQDPFSFDEGFSTPGLFQARYPDLKTMFLEHHWNQNRPVDVCNPALTGPFNGCEPYYFNQAIASTPATLFYDLSTRLLPNTEVLTADGQLIKQTGFGLWSRDTPLGESGYFGEFSFDLPQLSHHILTTDGILGRDTLASSAPLTDKFSPDNSNRRHRFTNLGTGE